MKAVVRFVAFLLAVIAGSSLHAQSTSAPTTKGSSTQPVFRRPTRILAHQLVMFKGAELFNGEFAGAAPTTQPTAGVILQPRPQERGYPLRGTWTSATIVAKFPFTEFLPSWNLSAPQNTGARFEVRVKDAKTGQWSPWLDIGAWGETPVSPRRDRITKFDGGTVDTDNLDLSSPCSAFQIRATLYSYDASGQSVPELRRVAAVYSQEVKSETDREALVGNVTPPPGWDRDLPVPYRAQGVQPRAISGSICSPTSVGMVMAYRGIDQPTLEVATKIYDNEGNLFGNWGRAVCYPSTLGLNGYLMRFSTMDEVRAMIATGQPVIASINFAEGEFPSDTILDSTEGHLIVIRGFTSEGDCIVNDPASRIHGNGIVYKAEELAHAWFTNTGGVGYVIEGKE